MRPITIFANNKVQLETTSTVVIRVKDKALRTSYFLYRAHVILRRDAFVLAHFIAPRTFKEKRRNEVREDKRVLSLN